MRWKAVICACADTYGVTVDAMLAETHQRIVVEARWAAMVVMRHSLGYTLHQIARRLHRDHTTVIYGLRQVGLGKVRNPKTFAAALAASRGALVGHSKYLPYGIQPHQMHVQVAYHHGTASLFPALGVHTRVRYLMPDRPSQKVSL